MAGIANNAVCKRANAGNPAKDKQSFDKEGKTSTLPKAKSLFRNEYTVQILKPETKNKNKKRVSF